MLRRSKIGWCDYSGADLNFVIGCTPVSEGCVNCYAKDWARRVGRDFTVVNIYWEKLNRLWKAKWEPGDKPYRRGPGSKPVMFPVDLGDLFHEAVDDELIFYALNIFWDRNDADWVLLTKRPARMLDITNRFLANVHLASLPPNIWCLVTAENQCRADERIPTLLQVKAQVRGVSVEPMLGPMRLRLGWCYRPGIGWIICGAESGRRRRPFERWWADALYQGCKAAGIPFFGKQDSGLRPGAVLHLPCLECGGGGYISDGLGGGEPCGCNAQRWEVKEFPTLKFSAGT